MAEYWLQRFVVEEGINSVEDFIRYVENQKQLVKIMEIAKEWALDERVASSDFNIFAGAGLNLADSMTCSSYNCRVRQVEILFKHAWHYFDKIYLPDAVGLNLLKFAFPDTEHKAQALDTLADSFAIFLYLKKIKALSLVEYSPAYSVDFDNASQVKRIINNKNLNTSKTRLKKSLLNDARYTIHTEKNKSLVIEYKHPNIDRTANFTFNCEISIEEAKKYIVNNVYKSYYDYYKKDISASQKLKAPLGSTLWAHNILLSRDNKYNLAQLEIKMPSINNISTKDLISLRLNEKDAFVRFRNALIKAHRELVANKNIITPEGISEQIRNDIINPELAKINSVLTSAETALKKKTALSVGLCALTATCGLIAGIPEYLVELSSITALITTAGTSALQHVDKAKEVEMSDMYFLWKALGHAKEK